MIQESFHHKVKTTSTDFNQKVQLVSDNYGNFVYGLVLIFYFTYCALSYFLVSVTQDDST